MTNHTTNRNKLVSFLKEDLVGPMSKGIIIDLNSNDRNLLAKGRVNSLSDKESILQQTLRRMELFGQLPQHVQNGDNINALELEALIAGPLSYDISATTELDLLRKEFFGDLTPGMMPKRPGPFLYESEYGSYEELITQGEPTERYVVGVLYPPKSKDDENETREKSEKQGGEDLIRDSNLADSANRNQPNDDDSDNEIEYEMSSNVMSISFFAFLPSNAKLKIHVTGGFYQKETVKIYNSGADKEWWKRYPLDATIVIDADKLIGNQKIYHQTLPKNVFQNLHSLGPDFLVDIYSRSYDLSGQMESDRIVTVCLRNTSKKTEGITRFIDQYSLFQTFFSVRIFDENDDSALFIKPYPSAELRLMDEEEQSMDLLYQKSKIFAIGHNCAANWGLKEMPTAPGIPVPPELVDVGTSHTVRWVCADCLPMYETAMMTPNILRQDGSAIDVSMYKLAGLDQHENGFKEVREILDGYHDWVHKLEEDIPSLHGHLNESAYRHIDLCNQALQRMEEGFQLIQNDDNVNKVFRWMNQAMLVQQLLGQNRQLREASISKEQKIVFSRPYQPVSLSDVAAKNRQWRPFQIAFLLLSITSTLNKQHQDRELVDLIWFPTGGGKTEAYLGLAAMSMLYRRLKNNLDVGTDVIMRYTMRLLSTQQFQRASGLLCALEFLRRQNELSLGINRFTIGMYVGGDSTPNNTVAVKKAYRDMQHDIKAKNPFIIRQCPWCGAQFGPISTSVSSSRGYKQKTANVILGYHIQGDNFVIKCSDDKCVFGGQYKLPILVVDENIYANPPTFLVGTVDKFANVTRNEEMRFLFGLDAQSKRQYNPPNLIIQDELHLISGPLGTTVGLFEILFEWLCTDNDGAKPKIISSTATIRQYAQQVNALFGRVQTRLFPPSGLYADDSYFATYARDKNGERERGRLYVGVCANGRTSALALQSRIYASLLIGATQFVQPEARDPWWTLLMYFNSLKDVGTATYLFQNTVPEDLVAAFQHTRVLPRRIKNFLELTGRLSGDEIPAALSALEQVYTEGNLRNTVDACLATNIIEVGVDIDRLALMTVYNQPKSTAQYIQATGRVGRRIGTPGLIVSVLSPYRMRDRSHYEHFRSYHERLYAQVEPTSVTPFSPTMLVRGVHVLIMGAIKQLMPVDQLQLTKQDYSNYLHIIKELQSRMIERAKLVDPHEIPNITSVFTYRLQQWEYRQPREWIYSGKTGQSPENALAYYAGTFVPEELRDSLWLLPTSMRNVDAVSNLEIMRPIIAVPHLGTIT